MAKKVLNARDLVTDIISGLSDNALMEKYKLAPKGLESTFKKLLDEDLITPAELDKRSAIDYEDTVDIDLSGVEFRAFSPKIRVLGENIQAFEAGVPWELELTGKQILKERGIGEPISGKWYSLQAFLDAMRSIEKKSDPFILTRIGEEISTHARLPSDLDELVKCLVSLDDHYCANHRGGDIGNWEFESLGVENGMNRVKMVSTSHYPCSFDHGVLRGFARKLKPEDCSDILVRHDGAAPCRAGGGDSCTYFISWWV